MKDLRQLYQHVIMDHNRNPRNFGELPSATHRLEGYNPLCGDRVTVYLNIVDEMVIEARFAGMGCAIAIASASLMTEAVIGQSVTAVEALFGAIDSLNDGDESATALPESINVLSGVRSYPSRIKCATLPWHTMRGALRGGQETVSTEPQ